VTDHAPKTALREKIFVGPAGWSYPDWDGIVYPAHHSRDFDAASYLANYFDAIEINTSFYQPLRPSVAARWAERLASHARFQFTAKLWKKFTHETGATAADEQAVREGFAPLAAAGKLAALLLQFPFSFHRTPENILRLVSLLDRFQEYSCVVEVRHSSWNDPEFYALLHERGAGFCNIDQPIIGRSIVPSEHATAPVGYIRLHGRRYDTWFSDDPMSPPEERYNYLYSRAELEPWANRIRKLAGQTRTTFVITNNHLEGKGVVNALELLHLLTGAKVAVPEPLRHRYPELEAIADAPAEEPTLFPDGPR
jgi:uncharacterized protein YecE (DUF72 family)